MQHHREIFFSLDGKRFGPIINCLPANYNQLEMCTLLNNILCYYRSRACRCVLHKCTTLSQTSPGLYVSAVQSYENTVGKGEIAQNERFLLSPRWFLPFWRTFCHFYQINICRLQVLPMWKSLKFVVWERVTSYTTCNSSRITYRQVCANHNSVMLKGFLHGMFVFHQFLSMK